MRKVTGRKRKLHIVGYKMIAMLLSVTFLSLQIAAIPVSAATATKVYPDAHGESNDSNDLYLWHLVEGSSFDKPLQDYLKFSDKKQPFRLLMAYYDERNYETYYYEANWTKLKYGKANGDICATYGAMTNVNENPQIRIGAKEFVTRGGLRAPFVSYQGQYQRKEIRVILGEDEYYHQPMYEFYPPNEKDDGVETINGNKVTMWFTRGKSNIDWWFYDGKGIPCGSSDYKSVWEAYDDSFAYYNDIKKGNFQKMILLDGDDSDVRDYDDEVDTYMFSCQETFWGADPQICHSDSLDRDYQNYANIPMNSITVAETYQTFGNFNQEWILYVGEKIGDNAKCIGGTGKASIGSSQVLDVPSYVKKNQTLVINEGEVLYVNSVLMLEGSIENHGLIIVEKNGAIQGNLVVQGAQITSRNGAIICDGGDLTIKSGGGVSVDVLIAKNGSSLVLGGKLYVKHLIELGSSLVDYTWVGENKGLETLRNLMGNRYWSNQLISKYNPQICIYPSKYNEYRSTFNQTSPLTYYKNTLVKDNVGGITEYYSRY